MQSQRLDALDRAIIGHGEVTRDIGVIQMRDARSENDFVLEAGRIRPVTPTGTPSVHIEAPQGVAWPVEPALDDGAFDAERNKAPGTAPAPWVMRANAAIDAMATPLERLRSSGERASQRTIGQWRKALAVIVLIAAGYTLNEHGLPTRPSETEAAAPTAVPSLPAEAFSTPVAAIPDVPVVTEPLAAQRAEAPASAASSAEAAGSAAPAAPATAGPKVPANAIVPALALAPQAAPRKSEPPPLPGVPKASTTPSTPPTTAKPPQKVEAKASDAEATKPAGLLALDNEPPAPPVAKAGPAPVTGRRTLQYGELGVVAVTAKGAVVFDAARGTQQEVTIGQRLPDGSVIQAVSPAEGRLTTDRGVLTYR